MPHKRAHEARVANFRVPEIPDTRKRLVRSRWCGLLGHEAVLLDLHAGIGAEGAVRAVEILAVRGVAHQVNPEPRGSRGKRDALGSLVHPATVVRVQLVDEEGRLVLDREEDIPDAVALHRTVFPAAEEQHRGVNTGERPGAANRGEGLVARVGCGHAGRHSAIRVAELADVGRIEAVIVGAARILGLLDYPVQADDRGERIA